MLYLIWIVGIVILDQIAKVLVIKTLTPHQSVRVIEGFFHLTHVKNTGGAFGILRSYGSWVTIVTLIVSFGLLMILFFGNIKDTFVKISLAIIVGGAVGNLIDRLRWGYVIDFLDFRILPVFNFADMAIIIGTVLIFVALLKRAGF
jgi:signal peptidase II